MGSQLFALGGVTEAGVSNTVERYDAENDVRATEGPVIAKQ